MTEPIQNEEYISAITDTALPNNWSVTRNDRFTVFIPGDGVVGDTVRAHVVKRKKGFAYGEIIEIIEPSPFRTAPPCPHFGICGGCIFQNLQYEKQLEIKKNYLMHSIKSIGGVDISHISMEPAVSSPDMYGYRNKMEFSFGENQGQLVLGMRERSSPFKRFSMQVFPIEQCLIFSERTSVIVSIIMKFLTERNYAAYNVFKRTGFLRNLLVREGKNTGELMVALVTCAGDIPDIEQVYRSLKDTIPDLRSFYWIINEKPANAVIIDDVKALYGDEYIEEELNGLRFRVYPETFFQPNSRGAELLYSAIAEWANVTPDSNVLGLYCGAGAIELSIARSVKSVLGIDSHPVNIETAHRNCEVNGITNCTFLAGRVEDVLKTVDTKDYQYIILDPPRGGLTPKAVRYICRYKVPQILYVSCNPSTLSRDLNLLYAEQYRIQRIKPFDLFPHTGHLETLVLLAKEEI
ncbi:MAG: 23S rRNA (uracil(1939)-C(5))-methyltransferase RlmD [Candidatus Auribacterota bacterium]